MVAVRGEISRARRVACAVALALTVLVPGLAACVSPGEPVPVPRFADPTAVAGVAPGVPVDDVGIPDDCERIMPTADLVALLGLPLDSVAVRTTIGVPEPSVGRVERVACRYTGIHASVRGTTLLELNAGRYVDDASAARQWRVNTGVESGSRRTVPFGTALAMLVERPDEALLSVVNKDVAVTMTMSTSVPRPAGRSTADTLVDLALRVLAVVTPPAQREPGAAG